MTDKPENLDDMKVRARRERTEEFFDKHKDHAMHSTFYGSKTYFNIEELYQAFKERMIMEIEND